MTPDTLIDQRFQGFEAIRKDRGYVVDDYYPYGWETSNQSLGGDLSDTFKQHVILDLAESFVGLSNSDPRVYDAMYFWDSLAHKKQMAKRQSKCAWFALTVLRLAGYRLPYDGMRAAWEFANPRPKGLPMKPLNPMSQITTLPGYKNWNNIFSPGSIMIIKGRSSLSTHALIVKELGMVNGKIAEVVSFDGGVQPVRVATRTVTTVNGVRALHDSVMGARTIIGGIDHWDIAALPVVRDYKMGLK